jgi:putative spermidine/putrescine transport system permease protein
MRVWNLFYVPLVCYVLAVSVLPLLFLVLTAFTENDMSGAISWDFTLGNFGELFYDRFYLDRMFYTIGLILMVTLITLLIALPVTLAIAQLGYFWRTVWLVGLFSSLALSEVLAVYAWQLMLSQSSGIPGWLQALGLIEVTESWWPSFPAMSVVLVYFTCPVAVIVLFPPISRLDPSLAESARTMGFGTSTIFLRIILPAIRDPLLRTGLLCFMLNIGSFVISQQLGRPSDWMISVFIADFMSSFSIPLAGSMALMLLTSVLLCLTAIFLIARPKAEA